jgi:hypothetical protein
MFFLHVTKNNVNFLSLFFFNFSFLIFFAIKKIILTHRKLLFVVQHLDIKKKQFKQNKQTKNLRSWNLKVLPNVLLQ